MSLFGCNQQIISTVSDYASARCIFKGMGSCGDHVSKFLCNNHSHIFGLIYKKAHYTNGDNEEWTRINTYVRTQSNFNIPLFKDKNDMISMTQVNNFAMKVCANHPNINSDQLSNIICCYLGLSASEDHCKLGGWLDDSHIIVRDDQDRLRYFANLPKLHKILFHYALPSITINAADNNSQVYLVDNVTLTYRSDDASYSFITPTKSIVLKYTNYPNYVATPIVLSGVRVISRSREDVAFRPMQRNDATC